MKIGIVTVYKSSNYGAFHQALALKAYLEKMGNEVFFIKHTARKPFISLLGRVYTTISNGNLRSIPFLLKQETKIAKSRDVFEEIPLKQAKELDLVILGSDEIWNIKRKNIRKYPIFFGVGIEGEKIISYAPSVNNADIEDFNNHYDVIEKMKQLSGISVRDNHSLTVISSIVEKEISLVTDPTMLHKKTYYVENVKEIKEDKPYILVYSYGKDSSKQKAEIENIKKVAAENDMRIVSIMGDLKWADKNIAVDPYEALGYFKEAALVVTDTFHGTIFSLMLEKDFWILPTTSKKVSELLNAVELKERNMAGIDSKALNGVKVDYEVVRKRIDEMRNKSISFLDLFINVEEK